MRTRPAGPPGPDVFGVIGHALREAINARFGPRQRGGLKGYVSALSECLRGQPEGNVAFAEVDRRAGVSRSHGHRLRTLLREAGLLRWGFPVGTGGAEPPAWGRGALRWTHLTLARIPRRSGDESKVDAYERFLERRRTRRAGQPPPLEELGPPSAGFAESPIGRTLERARAAAERRDGGGAPT